MTKRRTVQTATRIQLDVRGNIYTASHWLAADGPITEVWCEKETFGRPLTLSTGS